MAKNKEKYHQIIEAAVIVIAKNGYHQAQVAKIAKQAGVADGTIYLYFKNKEDILVSVFEEKLGEFVDRIEREMNKKHKVEDKLYALIKMHYLQLSENKRLAIVSQLELRQSNKNLRLKINQVLKPYLQLIDELIEMGIEEDIFRKDINIPLARQMVFGTLDETVTYWVMKEHKYDLLEQASDIHDLLLNSLK